MKIHFIKITVVASILFMMNACGGSTDVVDSGTYQGVIKKVEPAKTEIYVETADNKTLELYFTDQTILTHHEQEVEFTALKEGQPVEVEVEKVGKRLDPISVKILE